VAKVAVVELSESVNESFSQALKLIGSLDDLNSRDRPVVIKVGVFDHKTDHHSTVGVVGAIVNSFAKAPQIYLAESDNYKGTGSERLQKWKTLFSKRVVPFNLSEDTETRQVNVADEKIPLSHILFKPNVFVSTHILRVYERGSILKNLLGLIPDRKKSRFHKKLPTALLDMYEAIGGIDLAVLDGTSMTLGVASSSKRINTNILLVGRDAVAAETVGATLVGMNPENMPTIREAVKRGFGEGDLSRIEVVGNSLESLQERFSRLSNVKGKTRRKE